MEIRLPPDQEAHLAALAASAGRSADDIVQEAVALWEERQAQQLRRSAEAKAYPGTGCLPASGNWRTGNFLPEGETIKDLINYGRA